MVLCINLIELWFNDHFDKLIKIHSKFLHILRHLRKWTSDKDPGHCNLIPQVFLIFFFWNCCKPKSHWCSVQNFSQIFQLFCWRNHFITSETPRNGSHLRFLTWLNFTFWDTAFWSCSMSNLRIMSVVVSEKSHLNKLFSALSGRQTTNTLVWL